MEKCTEWPQMTLICSKSQIPTGMLIHSQGPNFCPFHSKINCFWMMAHFRKSAPNDPKWPWHLQGKKYQQSCYIHRWHPQGPNYCLFRSPMSCFWVMPLLLGKVHRMTPNDLDMWKIKNTDMHVNTPHPQFLPVSLYNEPFLSYGPIFRKVHRMTPNDLDIFKIKNLSYLSTKFGINLMMVSEKTRFTDGRTTAPRH